MNDFYCDHLDRGLYLFLGLVQNPLATLEASEYQVSVQCHPEDKLHLGSSKRSLNHCCQHGQYDQYGERSLPL
ncbi:hypothetical protein MED222_06270 [Vibrio sp. MED222]|nr:hypothetical protein MED222_06270 [Vibrio sp. MED222]